MWLPWCGFSNMSSHQSSHISEFSRVHIHEAEIMGLKATSLMKKFSTLGENKKRQIRMELKLKQSFR